MKNDQVDLELWHKRIQASRRRRDEHVSDWASYARLVIDAYIAAQDGNDSDSVVLPNGDQVKLALVFSNIEQTMAMLETPEIGLRAEANDFTRELGPADTHAEMIVEQGVLRSLNRGGLIHGAEETDYIKRDGVVIGHAINYTHYKTVTDTTEQMVPVIEEVQPNIFSPVFDESGQPVFEPEEVEEVIWENCYDKHVSPLHFLFDSNETKIPLSWWHGFEDVISIDELKRDPRYKDKLPKNLTGYAFKRADIYGDTPNEEYLAEDSVSIIKIYNKRTREIIDFIETAPPEMSRTKMQKYGIDTAADSKLILLNKQKISVLFDGPDDSPFNFFIPIPANDRWAGISQIHHIRNPSVEADKSRTRWANWVREIRRITWYNKNQSGLGEAIQEALNSNKVTPVGLHIDDTTPPDKLMGEMSTPNINPEVFQAAALGENEVRKISGYPETPVTGADTATESENQMQIVGARPGRKMRLYLKFLTDVARTHKAFLSVYAPDGQVLPTIGIDGQELYLPFGREAFQGEFKLQVTKSGGAMSISPVKQKLLTDNMSLMLGRFGPSVDLALMREVMTLTDMRNINAIMLLAQQNMGLIPPQVPGQQAQTNVNDISNGQAIRSAINAPNES